MGDGTIPLLLIVGTGFILLRPHDFPIFARNAGRVVGLTVRGLRRAKTLADDVIQRSAKDSESNPQMAEMRSQVQASLDHLSDLASTVRRDMSDVPLSPASFIRSRFQSAALQAHRGRQQVNNDTRNMEAPAVNDPTASAVSSSVPASASTASGSRSVSGPKISQLQNVSAQSHACTGADFVARSLEEAALARQYRKWFPSESKESQRDAPRGET